MNADRRTETIVESWLADGFTAQPDAERMLQSVRAGVAETSQRRRRWWPLPAFHRQARTPTAADTTKDRSSRTTATDGHAPTVIGRTQTMFSPVKAIAAGALVFAIGGAFLVAQPFGQPGSVPGAEQEASPSPSDEATTAIEMKQAVVTGEDECDFNVCETDYSDPRVNGRLHMSWTGEVAHPGATIAWGQLRLQGPDGQWTGPFVSTSIGQNAIDYVFGLAGSEAYEGWSFVGTRTESRLDMVSPVDGLIYEGDPPPVFAPPAE